jgi:3-isopropylmalate/(R)-2-methylmalate dehydratase small subunit
MEPITTFTARMAPLPINDIDTDQIVPARFLKVTDKSELIGALFADWRTNPDFPLNKPEYQGAQVIVGGSNFGCGSSREHAPWALVAEGFRAIISTDFADIFRNNALKNGLLPIIVPADIQQALLRQAQEDPTSTVTVNLEKQLLTLPNGGEVEFPIDGFAKYCLLNGVDDLGFLLSLDQDISAYENSHAARVVTTAPS